MLENWFILLPEICIATFFVIGGIVYIHNKETSSKSFFSLAQFFLLFSLGLAIVFYNKSAFPTYLQNNSFNTLFKTFVYLLLWAWFYLSSRWFLTKNRPSFKFYAICFALLLGFDILISSTSLLTLGIVLPYIYFFYHKLILRHWDEEKVKSDATKFAITSVFFTVILWIGIGVLYLHTESFEYASVKNFYMQAKNKTIIAHASVLFVLTNFMFIMAMVPFHHWFIGFISNGVLPVCGFLTLIPPLAYICAIFNLMTECFVPFMPYCQTFIACFACISLLIGAITSNYENNIRRLFGYISIYCMAFALIGLLSFSQHSITASFAYMVITLLSLIGIYSVFLGLKSKGDYLSETTVLEGFYTVRPYMSAALLIFIFSLMGIAPTLGFFGYLAVINNFVATSQWLWILLIVIAIFFVMATGISLIHNIYFSSSQTKFDRPDKAIYICLFVNSIIVLASLISPTWLLHDAVLILGGI